VKNKLTYLLASSALVASYASAEIVLTDDLSAYGYIDASYSSASDLGNINGSVAEFELGFAFSPVDSPWSAVSEISFKDGSAGRDAEFETVTISYAYSDELSFTVGNILSYQGFEAFDATGLYQFSYQGYGNSDVYSARYAYGVSADYATDAYGAGVWVGQTADDLSIELFFQYTGVEGLTATAVYADDPTYTSYNFWVSYEIDALTLAAEYVNNDFGAVEDEIYMLLAYYAMGDAGITFRYSTGEFGGFDFDRYTISPSYAFSDNVFGLLEYSFDDVDVLGEDTQLAAELIFSF
jgi:hypothetical protein